MVQTPQDHFWEPDTFVHSWESLAAIANETRSVDMLLDIGIPVMHHNVAYNCRAFLLRGRVLGIRPKMCLANDGNYRETRWFTAWNTAFENDKYAYGGLEEH